MVREITCPVCGSNVSADANTAVEAGAGGAPATKDLHVRRAKPFQCGDCGSILGLDCLLKVRIDAQNIHLIEEGDAEDHEDGQEGSIQVEVRCPHCGGDVSLEIDPESIAKRIRYVHRTPKVRCRHCGSRIELHYSIVIKNQVTVIEEAEGWE
jgi:DNA-directed RNA polymerase subunit RPC12/RpoP